MSRILNPAPRASVVQRSVALTLYLVGVVASVFIVLVIVSNAGFDLGNPWIRAVIPLMIWAGQHVELCVLALFVVSVATVVRALLMAELYVALSPVLRVQHPFQYWSAVAIWSAIAMTIGFWEVIHWLVG